MFNRVKIKKEENNPRLLPHYKGERAKCMMNYITICATSMGSIIPRLLMMRIINLTCNHVKEPSTTILQTPRREENDSSPPCL